MIGPVLEYLSIQPAGVYIDATAGLGGHTGAIARLLGNGFVFSSDRDADSLRQAAANTVAVAARIRFSQGPFSTLLERFRASELPLAQGLLADLGVSRYQLTD